jgi:CheY-like chemotaxis protein
MPFQTPRRTVLSVDDDEVNQIVITSFLEGAGYHVVQAMDGDECLEYLSRAYGSDMEDRVEVPDLVFLDVVMPGMDGFTVCREIRRRFPATLPVIMISAKMTKNDVIHGLSSGLANDYLTKPFDRTMMLAKMESRIALNDKIKALSAHEREDYCSRLFKPLLPIDDSIPVGLISLGKQDQVPDILENLQKRIEDDSIKILENSFGFLLISSSSHDRLLEVCLALKQKTLCFVLAPDRDLFRMIRLHDENPGNFVRVTERFFSRLSDSKKLNLGGSSFTVVSEFGNCRDVIHRQLTSDIEFLQKYQSTSDEATRNIILERRKYTMMREIVELEAAKSEVKSALSFENSNMDAIEHRSAKAVSFRKEFAQQLGLIDDL